MSDQQTLAERPNALPKLVSPRQVSLRVVGAVVSIEVLTVLLWWFTDLSTMSLALLLVGLLAWVYRRWADVHRALASNERARELLEGGRVGESQALLDELLSSRRTPPNIRPFAAFYRALVAARLGELHDADARLRAVIDSGWLGNRRSLQSLAPVVYATAMQVAVLAGDLQAAERWRSEGQQCAANLERHWFVADAFLLARRNQWSELLGMLERNWEAIEGTVSGTGIRQLQLLEAYAITQLGEDNYRGQHSGRDITTLLHGIRRGRFDHLAVSWPELREFMHAQRLLTE